MKIVTNGKKYRLLENCGMGVERYICHPEIKKDEWPQPIDFDSLEEAKEGARDNTWTEVE